MKIKTQKSLVKLGEKLSKNQLDVKSAKPRNQAALSPLLQKGGVFETQKPKAAHRRERRQSKQQLNKTVWL